MLPKSWIQHVHESTVPSFSYVVYPEDAECASDGHGERFHQDIVSMENMYKGKWSLAMLDDFCWRLKRDTSKMFYKRESKY